MKRAVIAATCAGSSGGRSDSQRSGTHSFQARHVPAPEPHVSGDRRARHPGDRLRGGRLRGGSRWRGRACRHETADRALRFGRARSHLRRRQGGDSAQGGARPAYVHDLVVAQDPAADHVSHDDAQRGGELPRAWRGDGPASWPSPERPPRRQGPRCLVPRVRRASGNARPTTRGGTLICFLKSPSAIVGEGEAIRIPRGRTQIDWECELGVVIARTAQRVPAETGARLHLRLHDTRWTCRIAAAAATRRYGSDWLIAKSHDTFAPMGPFITPKEFVPNPQKLPVKFTLNGKVMQDANTSLMIHDVFELVSYGSNILTLRPGDVIATGTPGGVGSARQPPIFLKPAIARYAPTRGSGR